MTVPDRPRVWRKASLSTNTDSCVEVALDLVVGVRDTKDRAGGELAVGKEAWQALTASLRS